MGALRVWDCLFISKSSSTLITAGIAMLRLEEDRISTPTCDFFETVQSLGKTQFDSNSFMIDFFLEQATEQDAMTTPPRCLPAISRAQSVSPFAQRMVSEVVIYAQQQAAPKKNFLVNKQSLIAKTHSSTRAAKVYQFPPPDAESLLHSKLGALQA